MATAALGGEAGEQIGPLPSLGGTQPAGWTGAGSAMSMGNGACLSYKLTSISPAIWILKLTQHKECHCLLLYVHMRCHGIGSPGSKWLVTTTLLSSLVDNPLQWAVGESLTSRVALGLRVLPTLC